MIKEEYISFEIARLLKDKGFNEKCNSYFISDNEIALISNRRDFNHGVYLSAPTQAMAMRWLREVHKIYIDINIHIILAQWAGYDINIYATNTKDCLLDKVISYKGSKYTSYEQACEAAIKYCLKNLI